MTNKDEALKWMIDNKKLESQYPTMTYEQGFAHGYEAHRVEQALERPSNMVAVPVDKLQDMQRRLKALEQPAQVTRLEVIDNNGRSYVNYGVDKLEFSYQDNGRTLKLFTNGAGTLQPSQEPVAWMNDIAYSDEIDNLPANRGKIIPLYAHPAPTWQGLTKYEIIQADNESNDLHAFARAIEAKLKKKNT